MKLKTGYASPRWTGEILDCSMPMTFDQYSHCSGDCKYCFSFFQKSLKVHNPTLINATDNYQKLPPTAVDVERVKRMFTGETKTQFSKVIENRFTMQWGGLADPFDMFEKKYGVGLELLRFFKEINYPICFSTKFQWWLDDPRYVELFREQKNWNCKFSIIGLGRRKAEAIEAGAPSPGMRLKAIEQYANLDAGGATLRLRPFIIGWSDEGYERLIRRAAERGATAVSTEFFCLEARANDELKGRYKTMSDALGFDILEYYRTNSPKASGYLRLNWKLKKPYIDRMEELCAETGMRFYVSDAHHKDRCANGSCCGLGKDWRYNRGQFTAILTLAKEREDGLVYWSDMEPSLDELGLDDFLWRKASGFNTSGIRARCYRYHQTMKAYIQEIWNSPNNAKSPYKYFQGLLRPVGVDSEKNVVYKYVPYKTT